MYISIVKWIYIEVDECARGNVYVKTYMEEAHFVNRYICRFKYTWSEVQVGIRIHYVCRDGLRDPHKEKDYV